ncbi:hypothetical protein SS50377_21864 [Spironucleus salmonicida]|uniref:Uncharacterized protein n=1 Tax=Spironucleus salmonicida TaxID=348837 RepID=V6LJ82_9EUKA|nr:hypothetical protein SS50377_21864 [Spironucleus salmonicida]|eukprot:EST44408.1 Hypothetical protein SS50377_15713 [Spironucleus salmonicida]
MKTKVIRKLQISMSNITINSLNTLEQQISDISTQRDPLKMPAKKNPAAAAEANYVEFKVDDRQLLTEIGRQRVPDRLQRYIREQRLLRPPEAANRRLHRGRERPYRPRLPAPSACRNAQATAEIAQLLVPNYAGFPYFHSKMNVFAALRVRKFSALKCAFRTSSARFLEASDTLKTAFQAAADRDSALAAYCVQSLSEAAETQEIAHFMLQTANFTQFLKVCLQSSSQILIAQTLTFLSKLTCVSFLACHQFKIENIFPLLLALSTEENFQDKIITILGNSASEVDVFEELRCVLERSHNSAIWPWGFYVLCFCEDSCPQTIQIALEMTRKELGSRQMLYLLNGLRKVAQQQGDSLCQIGGFLSAKWSNFSQKCEIVAQELVEMWVVAYVRADLMVGEFLRSNYDVLWVQQIVQKHELEGDF